MHHIHDFLGIEVLLRIGIQGIKDILLLSCRTQMPITYLEFLDIELVILGAINSKG